MKQVGYNKSAADHARYTRVTTICRLCCNLHVFYCTVCRTHCRLYSICLRLCTCIVKPRCVICNHNITNVSGRMILWAGHKIISFHIIFFKC